MRVARSVISICLLILVSLAVFGCGEKEEPAVGPNATIDEEKPISEVTAEAKKMDVKQLRAVASKYREAIEAKSAEIDKISDQLLKAAVSQVSSDKLIAGDKVKELKAQSDALGTSIKALADRFNIYVAQLKGKGEDVTDLEL